MPRTLQLQLKKRMPLPRGSGDLFKVLAVVRNPYATAKDRVEAGDLVLNMIDRLRRLQDAKTRSENRERVRKARAAKREAGKRGVT